MNDIATWLAERATTEFAYLTTVGRVTGTPHRIEMWFGIDGDHVFLMSGGRYRSDWVQNLMANPHVTLEIDGELRSGSAMTIAPHSPDDAIARELLVRKYQRADELAEWRRTALPIRIDFANPEAPQ